MSEDTHEKKPVHLFADEAHNLSNNHQSISSRVGDKFELVRQWGTERGIIPGQQLVSRIAQASKTLSETAELFAAYCDNDREAIIDAVGDIAVTLILQTFIDSPTFRNDSLANMLVKELEDREPQSLDYHLLVLRKMLVRVTDEAINGSYVLKASVVRALTHLHFVSHLATGYTLEQSLEVAYNEIKDRKGRIKNGEFIKDK